MKLLTYLWSKLVPAKPDYECKPANIQVHKGDPE